MLVGSHELLEFKLVVICFGGFILILEGLFVLLVQEHSLEIIAFFRLFNVILRFNAISNLVKQHNIAFFVIFHLITIIVEVNLVSFIIILLVCLIIDLLHDLAPLILKDSVAVSVGSHFQALLIVLPVLASLRVDYHNKSICIVQRDLPVYIPFYSVPVFIDEFRPTFLIHDQFIAI